MTLLKVRNMVAGLAGSLMSLCLISPSSLANWPNEQQAQRVAKELKVMVTAATDIIGELQPIINAGNPDAAAVDKSHLLQEFLEDYRQINGTTLNIDAQDLLGEIRRQFLDSYRTVLDVHQQTLLRGGEDSFVPAFFRSELLAEFNQRMDGKVKGYATNRELDLINPDWSIDALMDYSLFAYYIQELLEEQGMEANVQTIAGRVVGYYPMTLKPGCVSCHARQGLIQEVGSFGGALVTEVMLEQ